MKRLSIVLSVLIAVSMLLTACGTPATEATEAPAAEAPAATAAPAEGKTVLNVWSFTNEILTMADRL